ncbi:hypothetical protein D3C76_1218110 [compost metagenome]
MSVSARFNAEAGFSERSLAGNNPSFLPSSDAAGSTGSVVSLVAAGGVSLAGLAALFPAQADKMVIMTKRISIILDNFFFKLNPPLKLVNLMND